MKIQPISEAAHNQALSILIAERQELMYYREILKPLQERDAGHAQELANYEDDIKALTSDREGRKKLIQQKDQEIRQLQSKLSETTELEPVYRQQELEAELEECQAKLELTTNEAKAYQTKLKEKNEEITLLRAKAGVTKIGSWDASEYYPPNEEEAVKVEMTELEENEELRKKIAALERSNEMLKGEEEELRKAKARKLLEKARSNMGEA